MVDEFEGFDPMAEVTDNIVEMVLQLELEA
jgi:hypothetical protein